MSNIYFLHENVSPAAADIILEVEGEKTDMYSFMWTNLVYIDVDHISIEDAKRVLALKPGESTYINIVEVKRIN